MNSQDLAAKGEGLQRELGALDDERAKLALDIERGTPAGTRTMAGLNLKRAELVASIEQARLAHGKAAQEEETERRLGAQTRRNDEVEEFWRRHAGMQALLRRVDELTVELRDVLGRYHVESQVFAPQCNDPLLFSYFTPEIVASIKTVLSGSGYPFGKKTFYGADAKGRPDAAQQALAPRLPTPAPKRHPAPQAVA